MILVGEAIHFEGGVGGWLKNMLRVAGHDWASTTCLDINKDDIFRAIPPDYTGKIVALGEPAFQWMTGKRGVKQWRGSPLPVLGRKISQVVGTIDPDTLRRQAKLTSVVIGDLRRSLVLPPENYNLNPTLADVQAFISTAFAFDFEWDSLGNITLCGLSDRFYTALVVPFTPPFTEELRRIFENATHLIGHNIVGADLVHLDKLGWTLRPDVEIEDTMLKQHLCQPDYPHGLDFVASVWTQKVYWKGKWKEETNEQDEAEEATGQQWRTWDRLDALPRSLGGYGGCSSAAEAFALYNGRDTDAELQINTPLDSFIAKWNLRHTYKHVSLPAAYICRDLAERGLKLNVSRLAEIRTTIDAKVAEFEARLPDGLKPYTKAVGCNLPAPPGTYRPKIKTCKGRSKTNRHDAVDITFVQPDDPARACPECGRIFEAGKMVAAKVLKGTKEVQVVPYNSPAQLQAYVNELKLAPVFDHKTGRPTTGKKARKIWGKNYPEFALLGGLKKQITLRNNFAKTSLLTQERMLFNLKVHGTAEGRLSSSGQRRGIDLNIQNQPEPFRVIYVPDEPGWGFLNLDISQGENWLTAWIAKDWPRWERLQDPLYDEHADLASKIFNCPVSKELAKTDVLIAQYRQIAKKINHGRNYGMGVKKQLEVLMEEGFDHYSEADVKEFIQIWKGLNARTAEWQNETIETALRDGYLRNAFGRYRWFSSRAIATEALAFLPASTLADMVLRMMIAHYPKRFIDSIEANELEVYHPLCKDWILSIQVHDSLVPQGPWDSHTEQAERSHRIMTQRWKALDNFAFKVDIKGSPISWGDCKPLTI